MYREGHGQAFKVHSYQWGSGKSSTRLGARPALWGFVAVATLWEGVRSQSEGTPGSPGEVQKFRSW